MSSVLQAQRERVGRRIRAARKSAGLSHDALARQVGTSRQHLIKLEKGQHAPRDGMLARIAEATKRSEEWFTAAGDEDDEEADAVTDLYRVIRRIAREEMNQTR